MLLKRYVLLGIFIIVALVAGLLYGYYQREIRKGSTSLDTLKTESKENSETIKSYLLSNYKYRNSEKAGAVDVVAFEDQLAFIGFVKYYGNDIIKLNLGSGREDLLILVNSKTTFTEYKRLPQGIDGYASIASKDIKVGDSVAVRVNTSGRDLIALEIQKLIQ